MFGRNKKARERQLMINTLAFYANDRHWKRRNEQPKHSRCAAVRDQGARAVAVLAQLQDVIVSDGTFAQPIRRSIDRSASRVATSTGLTVVTDKE